MTGKARLKLLQTIAVLLGIAQGILRLPRGLHDLFTLGIYDNLITIVALIAYGFSSIPISIIGIFRPRLAGKLMLISVTVFLSASLLYVTEKQASGKGAPYDFTLLAVFVPPSLLIGTLFYKADDNEGQKGTV